MTALQDRDDFWAIFGACLAGFLLALGLGLFLVRKARDARNALITGDKPQPKGQPRSAHGGECPWTISQVLMTTLVLLDLGLFSAFLGPSIGLYDFSNDDHGLQVLSVLRFIILAIGVVCFIRFSSIDPGTNPQSGRNGLPAFCRCRYCDEWYSGELRKHCFDCNKCVVGFDHHCQYLNQCVGASNYVPWLGLIGALCCTMWIEVGINCYSLNDFQKHSITRMSVDLGDDLYMTISIACLMLELLLGLFSVDLFSFHLRMVSMNSRETPMTTLIWVGMAKKYPEILYNRALRRALGHWLSFEQGKSVEYTVFAALLSNYKLEASEQHGVRSNVAACFNNSLILCRTCNLQSAGDEQDQITAGSTTDGQCCGGCCGGWCDRFSRANFVLMSLSNSNVEQQALDQDSVEEIDQGDLFSQLDANNDGVVDLTELSSAIEHLGIDQTSYMAQLGQAKLTLDELQRACARQKQREPSSERVRTASQLFDQYAEDGSLSVEQLCKLETAYLEVCANNSPTRNKYHQSASAQALFDWADRDKDGKLSRKEWLEAVLGPKQLTRRESAKSAIQFTLEELSIESNQCITAAMPNVPMPNVPGMVYDSSRSTPRGTTNSRCIGTANVPEELQMNDCSGSDTRYNYSRVVAGFGADILVP